MLFAISLDPGFAGTKLADTWKLHFRNKAPLLGFTNTLLRKIRLFHFPDNSHHTRIIHKKPTRPEQYHIKTQRLPLLLLLHSPTKKQLREFQIASPYTSLFSPALEAPRDYIPQSWYITAPAMQTNDDTSPAEYFSPEEMLVYVQQIEVPRSGGKTIAVGAGRKHSRSITCMERNARGKRAKEETASTRDHGRAFDGNAMDVDE